VLVAGKVARAAPVGGPVPAKAPSAREE
jgi:hypothetical protein